MQTQADWIRSLSDDDLIVALEATELRLSHLNAEWLSRHPIWADDVRRPHRAPHGTPGRKAFLAELFFWGLSIPYVVTLIFCAILLVVL